MSYNPLYVCPDDKGFNFWFAVAFVVMSLSLIAAVNLGLVG